MTKLKYYWWDFKSFCTSRDEYMFAFGAIDFVASISLLILLATTKGHDGILTFLWFLTVVFLGFAGFMVKEGLASSITEKTAWSKLYIQHIAKFKSDKKPSFRIVQSTDTKGKKYYNVEVLITKTTEEPEYPFLADSSYLDNRTDILRSFGLTMNQMRDSFMKTGLGGKKVEPYDREKCREMAIEAIVEMNDCQEYPDKINKTLYASRCMSVLNNEDTIMVIEHVRRLKEQTAFDLDFNKTKKVTKEEWNKLPGINAEENEPYNTFRDSYNFYSKNYARFTLAWYATALQEKPKPNRVVIQENWDKIIPETADVEDDWSDF